MNYVISITGPEALGVLEDICEELALPLNVTLHGRGTAVQSMLATTRTCSRSAPRQSVSRWCCAV